MAKRPKESTPKDLWPWLRERWIPLLSIPFASSLATFFLGFVGTLWSSDLQPWETRAAWLGVHGTLVSVLAIVFISFGLKKIPSLGASEPGNGRKKRGRLDARPEVVSILNREAEDLARSIILLLMSWALLYGGLYLQTSTLGYEIKVHDAAARVSALWSANGQPSEHSDVASSAERDLRDLQDLQARESLPSAYFVEVGQVDARLSPGYSDPHMRFDSPAELATALDLAVTRYVNLEESLLHRLRGVSRGEWNLLTNLLNNIQTGVFLVLFLILSRPPHPGLRVLAGLGCPLLLTIVPYAVPVFPFGANLTSGLAAAVALAMVVGRLDSKFIDMKMSTVAMLYFYAALQVTWPFVQGDPQLEIPIILLALGLKTWMVLVFGWLLATGRVLYYFNEVRVLVGHTGLPIPNSTRAIESESVGSAKHRMHAFYSEYRI